MVEYLFNGGPVILQVDVGLCHECSFMSVPLVEGVSGPSPFVEVSQCGCKRSLDMVPLVLLFVELVSDGDPSLFHTLDVVCRPIVDEGVECSDVVKDHLITWIAKLVADLIIDDILKATLMQSQVGRQPLP